jgi:hypothetical protein
MRLEEYFATVARVFNRHMADGEVGDALAEGSGLPRDSINTRVNVVIAMIRQSLADNKALLGVFGKNGRPAGKPEEIKDREIAPVDLCRHIMAVRRSFSSYIKNNDIASDPIKKYDSTASIITRVLEHLTIALGVKDPGDIFSGDEDDSPETRLEDPETNGANGDDVVIVRTVELTSRMEPEKPKKPILAKKPAPSARLSIESKPVPSAKPTAKNLTWNFDEMPAAGTPEYDRYMEAVIRKLREQGKLR